MDYGVEWSFEKERFTALKNSRIIETDMGGRRTAGLEADGHLSLEWREHKIE